MVEYTRTGWGVCEIEGLLPHGLDKGHLCSTRQPFYLEHTHQWRVEYDDLWIGSDRRGVCGRGSAGHDGITQIHVKQPSCVRWRALAYRDEICDCGARRDAHPRD